jgi:hypothetical protein
MKKSCETVPLNVGVFQFLNLDLYFKIDELKSMLTSGGAELLRNLDSFDNRQVLSFFYGSSEATTSVVDQDLDPQ